MVDYSALRQRHGSQQKPVNIPASILSLPSELLLEIFQQHVSELYVSWCEHYRKGSASRHPPSLPPLYSWLSITLVCKRWHELAKSSPALWSFLIVSSPARVRSVLRASHPATIAATYFYYLSTGAIRYQRSSTLRVTAALDETLINISRLRTLDLHLDSTSSHHQLLLSPIEAPGLRSLSLVIEAYGSTIPCQQWRLPRLEKLEFQGRLTNLIKPFIRGTLKILILKSRDRPNTTHTNTTRLLPKESLDFLLPPSSVRGLRSLELDLAHYSGDIPVPLSFPNTLECLIIKGHAIHCVSIYNARTSDMRHLIMDGTKNLHQRYLKYRSLPTTDVARILARSIAEPPSTNPACSLLTLCITIRGGSDTVELHGWTTLRSFSFISQASSEISREAQICVNLPCRESERHLGDLWSSIKISDARILRLGPMEILGGLSYVTPIGDLFRIFNSLREVRTLVAYSLDIWLLLSLILPQQHDNLGICFPKLQTLILVDIKFAHPKSRDGSAQNPAPQSDDLVVIANMDGLPVDLWRSLAIRCATGHPIETLVIKRASNFHVADAESLREVVRDVDWDESKSAYVPNAPSSPDSPASRTSGHRSAGGSGIRKRPVKYY